MAVRTTEEVSQRGEFLFKNAVRITAISMIVLLAGVIVLLLFLDSREAIAQFGFSFLYTSEWDPVFQKFGAAPYIFGTIVTSVSGAAAGDAVRCRRRAVHFRVRAQDAWQHPVLHHRTASRHPQRRVWVVGFVRAGAIHAQHGRSVSAQCDRSDSDHRRTVQGTDDWSRLADRQRHFGDHDFADDYGDFARNHLASAAPAKRRHAGARRDRLGNAA